MVDVMDGWQEEMAGRFASRTVAALTNSLLHRRGCRGRAVPFTGEGGEGGCRLTLRLRLHGGGPRGLREHQRVHLRPSFVPRGHVWHMD